jgi:cytoskeletal protein CcmA (bactofilin family)
MARNIMSVFGQNGRPGTASEAPAAVEAEAVGAPTATKPSSAPLAVMTLGKTLFFKGELSADEDIVLFGRVEGSITHTGSVTIGIGGTVLGNVRARSITVKGSIEGDLEASDSVVVAPSAVVNGDIVAARVSIVDGAKFNGAVEMLRTAVESKPAADGPMSDKAAERLLGER